MRCVMMLTSRVSRQVQDPCSPRITTTNVAHAGEVSLAMLDVVVGSNGQTGGCFLSDESWCGGPSR